MTLAPQAGRRIVVAGGCGGIGRALVDACLDLQLHVAILDHPTAIERNPPRKPVLVLPVDASEESSLNEAFRRLGGEWPQIDILVFLIGIPTMPPTPAAELATERWDRVIDVNLRAAFLCARLALPQLHRSDDACIVNVSSSLAFNPNKGSAAYVASKGGIVSLTKALAMENAPRVRANVVAPSAVDTEFLYGGAATPGANPDDHLFKTTLPSYLSGIPMARLAEPADVVGPILFLAGPGARYITGQVLHVNGGRITP